MDLYPMRIQFRDLCHRLPVMASGVVRERTASTESWEPAGQK